MHSPTYISYIRVSTSRQGESGLGLEAQQEAVRRHISSVGGSLLSEHVEIEGGKSATRPILLAALAECKRTKSKLLIAKLDRLSRSVAFVAQLMETKVDFVALDAPFATPLILHIMAAFAEHEREMISQRTKAALAAAKARGTVLGSHGRILAELNRASAQTFAESVRCPVQNLMTAGRLCLKDIALGLNDAGLRTREGAAWGPTSVQRILRRLDLRTPAMTEAGRAK